VSRIEVFDPDRAAEALARFDELTAGPAAARPVQRRVRPNAATATGGRWGAAIAERDADALPGLLADEGGFLDHTTGTTWGRGGSVRSLRALFGAKEPSSWQEPLAILGDALALIRWSTSASGFSGATFDVGAYQREEIDLVEVDAQGRRRRGEGFAPDH